MMHQSVLYKAKHNIVFRLLPLLFAAVMLCSGAPAAVRFFSDFWQDRTTVAPQNLPVDETTLKITLDGSLKSTLALQSYEKKTISATGLKEKATYQWQIKHPEKENMWVNIYDATSKDLPVSMALVKAMMNEKGNAYLRCRAYTNDYTYLTSAIAVNLASTGSSGTDPLGGTGSSTDNGSGQTPQTGNESLIADSEGEEKEFVTITIEYQLYGYVKQNDGTMGEDPEMLGPAFSSYVAMLQYGSDLEAENGNIHSPEIVGYTPYLVEGYRDDGAPILSTSPAEYVNIAQTNVTEDKTYIVQYHPAMVDYEVRYFFQNIYDDLYVEDDTILDVDEKPALTIRTEGYTGMEPDTTHTERLFPGFTSLYYQPEAIAADGSTIFQVFFERDYYLMEFDCNGGYGADTIYVRYGTYISVPNPVRMGYEFAGWNKGTIQYDANGLPIKDDNGRVIVEYEQDFDPNRPDDFTPAILPSAMGMENSIYRAEWKNVKTTYTVAYWREKADGSGYDFWGNAVIGLGDDGEPDGTVISNTTVSGTNNLTNNLALCGTRPHSHATIDCDKLCDKLEHTNSCCDKEEHTSHNSSCCALEAHSHGISCLWGYNCSKSEHTHGTGNCIYSDTLHTHGDGTCNITRCTNAAHHTHTSSCYSCGLTAHTHTDTCYTNESQYYTFVEADQNKTVQGDGSTVVNVYYTPKEYELRFYYVRTNTSGGSIQVANSTGSGYNANNGNPFSSASWANPNSSVLPTITDDYFINGGGTSGFETVDGNLYHYLSFKAKYNENIEEKWPAASLGSLNNDIWNFGSWASESGSGYRANHSASNANIVGAYPYLTAELVVDPNADVSSGKVAHHFVAWWGQEGRGTSSNDKVSSHFYHIYYEVFPGHENDPDVVSYTYDGVTKHFQLSRNLQFNAAHKSSSPTRVDPFVYTGYEIFGPDEDSDSSDNMNNSEGHQHYCNTYYYIRKEHTLSFYNYNDSSETLPSQKVKYEQPFSGIEMPGKPPYPAGIEPGAYDFVAWYTTPIFDESTRLTEEMWQNMIMPDGDVALYAKWVPIQRKVTFYHLYTDLETSNTWKPIDKDGNVVDIDYPILIEHGSLLGTTYAFIPEREGYDFIGWFYMDQDNKKKFAPDSMEIRRDLHLFAEWHSKTDTQYEVSYKLDKEATINGTKYPAGTVIGEPTTGHASAGKTKTFTAKDRAQLNSPFNLDTTALFPTLNSHSILMSDIPADNVFDFTYVVDEEVWYKVRYVDKTTNAELRPSKIVSNRANSEGKPLAVVTEKFLPIQDYIPEQYYIRKVLASDDAYGGSGTNVLPANEIIFYYIPDTEHALYTIEYYKENLDGSFELVQSALGSDKLDIDVKVEINANKYNGFAYSYTTVTTYVDNPAGDMTVISTAPDAGGIVHITAPLTLHGIEIRVYYERIEYPYVIKFMENGTTNVLGYGLLNPDGTVKVKVDGNPVFTLAEVKAAASSAKFEKTLSYMPHSLIAVGGSDYRLVDYDPAHPELAERSLTIRTENADYDALVDNDIIFWYNQRQTTVYYQAVCDTPGAIDFGLVTRPRETTSIATNLGGSIATPGNGYRFVGWFDEKGDPVDANWVDDQTKPGSYHLKPQAFNDHNGDDEVYYYAHFAPVSTDLTVTKTGVPAENQDAHNFIFRVKGEGKLSYVELTFVITGNGSVTIKDIPIGEYVITELQTWSWEYTPVETAKTVTAQAGVVAEVTFQNTFAESNWLDGEVKRSNP